MITRSSRSGQSAQHEQRREHLVPRRGLPDQLLRLSHRGRRLYSIRRSPRSDSTALCASPTFRAGSDDRSAFHRQRNAVGRRPAFRESPHSFAPRLLASRDIPFLAAWHSPCLGGVAFGQHERNEQMRTSNCIRGFAASAVALALVSVGATASADQTVVVGDENDGGSRGPNPFLFNSGLITTGLSSRLPSWSR